MITYEELFGPNWRDGEDDKLDLDEVIKLDAFDEYLVADKYGDSRIRCPKEGCSGSLIIKESRYGYESYIGCTSKACNYYTTIKKLCDRFLKLKNNE